MKTIIKPVLSFIALLFFTAGVGSISNSADTSSGWKARWETTVEAAKKEGQVTIYGGDEITHPAILSVFNKRFPEIRVVTASGHSEVIQRVVAERRAQKFLVDLYSLGPGSVRTAYRAKFLQPIRPVLMLPEVTDTSLWYSGKHLFGDPQNEYIFVYEGTPASSSMAYNTEKFTDLNEITSYWDILKAKWRGNIGFYNYGAGSVPTPMLVLYYNPQVGPKFMQRLFGEMDLTFSRDRRQATNWLARGRYTLCFMCRDVERAKQQGLPVEGYPYENIKEAGALGGGNSSVLAFLNKAPHPNAAKVFINWFLSREGQETWQRVMNTVVLEESDSMRIDISKDNVIPMGRRTKNREYPILGYLDAGPVRKFYQELVTKAIQMKGDAAGQ